MKYDETKPYFEMSHYIDVEQSLVVNANIEGLQEFIAELKGLEEKYFEGKEKELYLDLDKRSWFIHSFDNLEIEINKSFSEAPFTEMIKAPKDSIFQKTLGVLLIAFLLAVIILGVKEVFLLLWKCGTMLFS